MDNHDSFFCSLPSFGVLGISGTDAAAFLQGQATNDVTQISDSRTQLTAFCNPRGRVMALGRLVQLEGTLALALPPSMVAPLRQWLARFVLRAAVSLEDISSEYRGLGIAGTAAARRLAESGHLIPQRPDGAVSGCGVALVRVPGEDRFEAYGAGAAIEALAGRLADNLPRRPPQEWLRGQIAAGVPWLGSEMSEAYIPQMLNLDVLGAVSFTKGCYTGQEIVARTRHLGSVKRRMRRFHANQGRCPAPGESLYLAHERVAEVVTASPDDSRGHELLAVAPLALDTSLSTDPGSAPALQLRPLPYAIPAAPS